MDPACHAGHQIVICVAKAGRAGLFAVTRVGTAQAGAIVGDDHGGVPVCIAVSLGLLTQSLAQPVFAHQSFCANSVGIKDLAVAHGPHHFDKVIGRTHGARALFAAEQVKVAPTGGADKADASPIGRVVIQVSFSSRWMPRWRHWSRRPAKASSTSRPSNSWLPGTKTTGVGQFANRLRLDQVVSHVSGQHQKVRPRGCPGRVVLGLEVQVRQELKLQITIQLAP
jgi:hypothetical protein